MQVQESRVIRDTFQATAGDVFKGEKNPGVDLWNITVPEGKQWTVIVNIEILEGDIPPE